MLSEALTRYVDLHRSVGFKFRIQHLLLRNFVRFAEAHGDEFVRVARVLDWAARAPSRLNAGTGCSPRAALLWRCAPRILVMSCRQPMRSAGEGSSGERRTYMRRTRSQHS